MLVKAPKKVIFIVSKTGTNRSRLELLAMKFIGIDLGWVSGANGLCCLQLQGNS